MTFPGVAAAPQWLIDKATATPIASTTPTITGSVARPQVQPHHLILADGRAILSHIRLEEGEYEQWFGGVVALRRTWQGAQDGSTEAEWLQLADDWSATQPGYQGRADVESKWLQAGTRPYGFGAKHLIDLAKEGGWQPTPEQAARLSRSRVSDPDAFEAMAEGPGDASTVSRFKPRVPNLNAPLPTWLIKGVLQRQSLAVIYGKWGSGKSAIATEIAVAIAQGMPWHGRKTERGRVVYIANENITGFRGRLDALLRDQGLTVDGLQGQLLEIDGRPNLLKPEDVQPLIAELKALGPLALIIVDTWAQATVGAEENSAKETGVAVANCQAIRDATGACVCLIHHTGKDESKGMRGSSNLPASIDTEIALERPNEGDIRTASVGKQRDGADYFRLFDYALETVVLGKDEDGDPITSVAVREVIAAPESSAIAGDIVAPKSAIQNLVWQMLTEAMRPMTPGELISAAVERLLKPDEGKADRRRDKVRQAIDTLVANRTLTHIDGLIALRDYPRVVFPPVSGPPAPYNESTKGPVRQDNGDLL